MPDYTRRIQCHAHCPHSVWAAHWDWTSGTIGRLSQDWNYPLVWEAHWTLRPPLLLMEVGSRGLNFDSDLVVECVIPTNVSFRWLLKEHHLQHHHRHQNARIDRVDEARNWWIHRLPNLRNLLVGSVDGTESRSPLADWNDKWKREGCSIWGFIQYNEIRERWEGTRIWRFERSEDIGTNWKNFHTIKGKFKHNGCRFKLQRMK